MATITKGMLLHSHRAACELLSPAKTKALVLRLKAFLLNNVLLVGFLFALAWALLWPEPGIKVASIKVGKKGGGVRLVEFLNNCLVFLVSGLTLRSEDLLAAIRQWPSTLYGVVGINLLTPCVALVVRYIPLQPSEFTVGLVVYCVVPTTLGTGVVLTQSAKGNEMLALLLIVVTNMLAVVTVPYLLHAFLEGTPGARGGAVEIKPKVLATKLALTVLVPTIVGMAIRGSSQSIRAWVVRHKTALGLFSIVNVITLQWQAFSGAREVLLRQSAQDVLLVLLITSTIHVFYLILNYLVVKLFPSVGLREKVALIVMVSQKSSMVMGVTVISYITEDLAQQGLFAVPCLVGHQAQILISSLVVKKLATVVTEHDNRLVSFTTTAATTTTTTDAAAPPGEGVTSSIVNGYDHKDDGSSVRLGIAQEVSAQKIQRGFLEMEHMEATSILEKEL